MSDGSPQEEWDALAPHYAESVLSVFDCDREGLVAAAIAAAGARAPGGRAADLGCGVGKFLPTLLKHFRSVEACDFSPTSLESAQRSIEGPNHAQISFHQLDLRSDPVPFEPVDCVLCVNVLHMPDLDERLRVWRTVTNQVAFGGMLILVVPSLEAIKREQFRNLEAHLDSGDSCVEALDATIAEGIEVRDLYQGIHRLDGIRTKHYLSEELRDLVERHELRVRSIKRLGYRHPENGSKLPFEDWLVVAERSLL